MRFKEILKGMVTDNIGPVGVLKTEARIQLFEL